MSAIQVAKATCPAGPFLIVERTISDRVAGEVRAKVEASGVCQRKALTPDKPPCADNGDATREVILRNPVRGDGLTLCVTAWSELYSLPHRAHGVRP
jgi:hypothetical protein